MSIFRCTKRQAVRCGVCFACSTRWYALLLGRVLGRRAHGVERRDRRRLAHEVRVEEARRIAERAEADVVGRDDDVAGRRERHRQLPRLEPARRRR